MPAFDLHARETVEPLDDVLDGLLDHAAAVDHFELYWMPGGGKRCQVKRNVRTDEPAPPAVASSATSATSGSARTSASAWSAASGAASRGRRPTIAKLVTGAAAERDVIDRSDQVFCTPAARCTSSRWSTALPVEHLADAVRELRARDDAAADADPVPDRGARLGRRRHPAVDRLRPDIGWIAVHQYRGAPYEEYFEVVERIMDGYGGRPHWGKLHGQRAATLAGRVPAVGRLPGRTRQARPGPHVRQPVPRARAGSRWGRTRWRRVLEAAVDRHRSRRPTAPSSCSRLTRGAGRPSSPSPATPTCSPTSTAQALDAAGADGFGGASHPDVLQRIAGPGGEIGALDAVLVGRGETGPVLPRRHDLDDHPRVPSGPRTTAATSRCTATTSGSSSSVAASSDGASWPSSCSTRRRPGGPATAGG